MRIQESVYEAATERYLSMRPSAPDDSCWEWTGSRTALGYGRFKFFGTTLYAHRMAYYISHGTLPDGEIDHTCRHPWCVNPKHLEDVTHRENVVRSPSKHKSYCDHGHEMTPANTYISQRFDGRWHWEQRTCRTCHRLSRALARAKVKA